MKDGLRTLVALTVAAGSAACGREPSSPAAPPAAFAVEEATIDGIHAAIQSGRTSCSAIVGAYIDRARAYNGVCTSLVTADGADIAPATGYVRAGAPLTFPTRTAKASTIFPDLDQYRGKPLDDGRMEPTISDPSVAAQTGMRVGIPNAGQLNALETASQSSFWSNAIAATSSFLRSPRSRPAGLPGFVELAERVIATLGTGAGSRSRLLLEQGDGAQSLDRVFNLLHQEYRRDEVYEAVNRILRTPKRTNTSCHATHDLGSVLNSIANVSPSLRGDRRRRHLRRIADRG